MKRRSFLSMSAAAGASLCLPRSFGASSAVDAMDAQWRNASRAPVVPGRGDDRLLILIELKGGNDGLNTVIPFADPAYYALRKNIGIQREQMLQLDERTALHPALQPLMPLWRSRQFAIVQGLSYAQPNLSHFRSIEIWDTASRSDQYLRDGWLTRAFAMRPVSAGFAADGVVIGSAEMGPLANGARAITQRNPALAPILDVENDMPKAADPLRPVQPQPRLQTVFPGGTFGNSIKTAMQLLAASDAPKVSAAGPASREQPLSGQSVAVIRLTLNGFDTHHNQPGQQAALLKQLSEGMVAMRAALVEFGRWNGTLVMTYAEFGRRPRENESNGTDHGTVAPHFVMGGRVRGGLYGVPPMLARLDGQGNLPVGVDFRQLYATVLGPWWGLDASAILQQRFEPLPLLRA
ncbi:DUF1501 domain-containing protein [Paraburkholderia sprentiae WSM5005]|uniref:DUF1501 domain-containing protein n=1 Tax=Paraburkholderia sprentiae WSM5005 TaxID=754502 RepID=A0A1I9YKW2_9BURK|nr:DUF1501 domain-containing protein [Paraburkholderia sprentiae]APA86945.1 DUF1501 domain-containing protein [Paraburkholderia sprentiae WSM5005]